MRGGASSGLCWGLAPGCRWGWRKGERQKAGARVQLLFHVHHCMPQGSSHFFHRFPPASYPCYHLTPTHSHSRAYMCECIPQMKQVSMRPCLQELPKAGHMQFTDAKGPTAWAWDRFCGAGNTTHKASGRAGQRVLVWMQLRLTRTCSSCMPHACPWAPYTWSQVDCPGRRPACACTPA